MKKVIMLLAVVLGIALTFTACDPEKGADVKFQLDVDGLVVDSATNITSNFNGHVANTDLTSLATSDVEFLLVSDSVVSEGAEATATWVDDMVTTSIKAQFGNNSETKYRVHVEGYVREETIGTEIKVNKTVTNM